MDIMNNFSQMNDNETFMVHIFRLLAVTNLLFPYLAIDDRATWTPSTLTLMKQINPLCTSENDFSRGGRYMYVYRGFLGSKFNQFLKTKVFERF